MSDSGFRLDGSPEWPPRPSTRSERHKSLNLLDQRIDTLRAGQLPERRATRILVIDLIIAARALSEFRLLAAGSMWATLDLTEEQRTALTRAGVAWSFD